MFKKFLPLFFLLISSEFLFGATKITPVEFFGSHDIKFIPFKKTGFRGDLSSMSPFAKPPKLCITHHSANSSTPTAIEKCHCDPKSEGGFGFSAIGYNFLIDAKGIIYESRPEGCMGAHTIAVSKEGDKKSFNPLSYGICLIGCFTEKEKEQYPPTPQLLTKEMEKSFVLLSTYLHYTHGWSLDLREHHIPRSALCKRFPNSPGEMVTDVWGKILLKIKEALEELRAS